MKTQASPKKPVAKKPVATQKSTVQKKAATAHVGNGTPVKSSPQNEEIALRAYKIWQEQGCPEGFDEVHWHLAEQEIMGTSTPAFAS